MNDADLLSGWMHLLMPDMEIFHWTLLFFLTTHRRDAGRAMTVLYCTQCNSNAIEKSNHKLARSVANELLYDFAVNNRQPNTNV